MLHIPINHHLRPLYRALAGLGGLYVLVFGLLGVAASRGLPAFAQPHDHKLPWVLGLRTNLAFAVLSIAVGLVLLLGNVVGRNLDYYLNLLAGAVFMVAGMAMMILMQTDLNFLGFSMVNCIVSFILGTLFLTAGLYCRSGPAEAADHEEAFRHGSAMAR
jgi:hypothetical protein